MKLTEKLVRKIIEESIPVVEEENKLKTELDDYLVTLWGGFQNGYIHRPKQKFLICPGLIEGKKELKSIMFHEVFHNAQNSNFKDIFELYENLRKYKIVKNLVKKAYSIRCLIEGDATLIERNLSKKYLNYDPYVGVNLELLKNNLDDYHVHGEKILREKFKGNRKDINELYTAPVEELVKIFGGNEK
ncbi:MAG: hypothetical protein NUV46_03925 [Nanoarchaeota archaeon]|nr:hypothetical protein [Nanoarchaeota archaeon]